MKDSKVLLILERSSSNLVVNKESGDYILEGIFAQFGVENNNKRIYEEKEYLPHLEYLQKKISQNRLMGELDHPEKFEVSLDKVSHVIENLEYDQSKRQIKGRVRILDTPSGKIAKALIDSNVPISISSRAAGSVSENKSVSIKRIFTYDLVADPGFEDAQLSRVNESFGLGNEDHIQIFDASAWDSFSFGDDKPKTATVEKVEENIKKEKIEENMKEFVTVENMERYSLMVKEEISKINERLSKLNESNTDSSEIAQIKEQLASLEESVANDRRYMQYVAEMLDESISWSENEISEQVKNLIEYTQTEIAPHVDGLIEHNNYLTEKLNHTIGYVNEELAPMLDESINHNDYLVEEINNNRKYTEYLAENAVDSKNFDSLVEYTEMIYEGLSSNKLEGKINEETPAKEKTVLENKSQDIEKKYTDINEKIDAALSQIKKQKSEEVSEKRLYPFVNILNESNRATFDELNKTEKEKVSNALKQNGVLSAHKLNENFNSLIEGNFEVKPQEKWLSEAPEKYKVLFEGLDASMQSKIRAQAEWYRGKLESVYQIENFWATRGLNEDVELKNLKDETDVKLLKENEQRSNQLGYSSERVKLIKESLKRFK